MHKDGQPKLLLGHAGRDTSWVLLGTALTGVLRMQKEENCAAAALSFWPLGLSPCGDQQGS